MNESIIPSFEIISVFLSKNKGLFLELYITYAYFLSIAENLELNVSGTLNIKCDKLNIQVSDDYKQQVNGDKSTLIKGTNTTDITGAVKEDYGSTYDQSIVGKTVKKFGDTLFDSNQDFLYLFSFFK